MLLLDGDTLRKWGKHFPFYFPVLLPWVRFYFHMQENKILWVIYWCFLYFYFQRKDKEHWGFSYCSCSENSFIYMIILYYKMLLVLWTVAESDKNMFVTLLPFVDNALVDDQCKMKPMAFLEVLCHNVLLGHFFSHKLHGSFRYIFCLLVLCFMGFLRAPMSYGQLILYIFYWCPLPLWFLQPPPPPILQNSPRSTSCLTVGCICFHQLPDEASDDSWVSHQTMSMAGYN